MGFEKVYLTRLLQLSAHHQAAKHKTAPRQIASKSLGKRFVVKELSSERAPGDEHLRILVFSLLRRIGMNSSSFSLTSNVQNVLRFMTRMAPSET